MSFQQVILIGRLGQDAELTKVRDTTVAKFSVATKETWRDKEGNKQEATEWHRVELWGKQADAIGKWLEKGREVCVIGKINSREYEKDGVKKIAYTIRADRVTFVGSQGESGGRGGSRDEHSGGEGRRRSRASETAEDETGRFFPDDDIPF